MTSKTWKRILSLLFAMVLLLSLAVPAFGEEEPGQDPGPEAIEQETEAPAETAEPVQEEQPEEQPSEGGISRVGGELPQPETPAQEYTEIFVSAQGSDESGDGSQAAPYATLARAAVAANQAPTALVYVLVTSDLEIRSVARFAGKTVILQGQGGQWTLRRAEAFQTAADSLRGEYHPAMIELGSPDGARASAALMVENLILDDMNRHVGEKAEAQQPLSPAAAETPEETEAPQETPAPVLNNLDKTQDAVIAAYGDSSLILSAGSELRNFGGLSAVRLTGRSRLVAQEGSAIQDVQDLLIPQSVQPQAAQAQTSPAALSAVRLEDNSAAQVFDGARIQEREGAAPSLLSRVGAADTNAIGDILNPGEGDEDASSLDFTVDPTEVRFYNSLPSKDLNYSLSFTLSEDARSKLETASKVDYVAGVDFKGTVTVKLDARLTQELVNSSFSSQLFELDGDPTQNADGSFVYAFKLRSDWKDKIGQANQVSRLNFTARLPIANFQASTAEKDEIIKTGAKVDLELKVSTAASPVSFSLGEKTAETKMLSAIQASSVIYDVNGGNAGTGPVQDQGLSEQQSYSLKKSPAPTHAEESDGTPIIFIGWSKEKDEHIYVMGDEAKPQTTDTVTVPGMDPAGLSFNPSVTVYAVWGYDENEDGEADVNQILATLTFDANGGVGAPEPITHVVGTSDQSASGLGFQVDIPEQEPTRDYYTFDGWSEDPGATEGKYKYDADKNKNKDIRVTEDKTLYAVWVKNYTLYYDANGGTNAPAAQTLLTQTKNDSGKYSGKVIITSEQPTRSGYAFKGWATTRRGAAQFLAGDEAEITGGDVTLYAVWERTASSSGTYTGSTNATTANGGNPKTGDENNPVFFGALALGALAAIVLVVIFLLRRSKKDKAEK